MWLKTGIWSLLLWSVVLISPTAARSQHSVPDLAKTDIEQISPKSRGSLSEKISWWEQEAKLYRTRKETAKEIETLLKISQGYISLGQFRAATIGLNRILSLNPDNSDILALAQKRLGDAYSGTSNYKQAIASYQSSLQAGVSVPTLNNLVQVYRDRRQDNLLKAQNARRERDARPYQNQAKRDRSEALKYARRALSQSQTHKNSSALHALIEWHNWHQLSDQQLKQGQAILENLSTSRSTAFLMLNWAKIDSANQIDWLHRAVSTAGVGKCVMLLGLK